MHMFIIFIFSLFLTIALIPIVRRIAFRVNLVDDPDERKVHVLPMPRSGGICMAIGAFVPVAIWVPIDQNLRAVFIGAAIIVFFGVVDDIKNLKYTHKLLAQATASLVVIFLGNIQIHCIGNPLPTDFVLPFFISMALTLLFIVGITNAINLSDGLDGLAGGISMLSFVSIGFMAYRCENMELALLSTAVVGAILGFLRYNTHPATIFMGDGGSQLLGFLGAVFTIMLTQSNTPYSQVTPLFLIGFPILDTLTVMVERIVNGGSPFKPDKNHFHHKLMKLGLYHSESVITIYLLQALFISFAFVLRFYSNGTNLMAFIALAGVIISMFEIARKNHFQFRKNGEKFSPSPSILSIIGGERLSIRVFFNALKWGLATLFLVQCIICKKMPGYMTGGALLFIVLIIGVRIIKPNAKKEMLRVALYCTIPLLIYFSTTSVTGWMTHRMEVANNLLFIIMIVFVIGTLNLTKRRKGFKVNPLDFLIVIIIIIFPNLPGIQLQNPLFKMVVAKSLILFFSYEVLLGELRKEDNFLDISLMAAFAVIAIKGSI